MSESFPTHRQFTSQIRARLHGEYPDADRESIEDCVRMQAGVSEWLHHLGQRIEQGAEAELRVLDTLTASQLHALKMYIAPRGSLDWYIPAIYRRQ